jgi:hypothetical protein
VFAFVFGAVADHREQEGLAEAELARARAAESVEGERAALRRLVELRSGEQRGEASLQLAELEDRVGTPSAVAEALTAALTEAPDLQPAPALFAKLVDDYPVRLAWLDARVGRTPSAWRVGSWDATGAVGLVVRKPDGEPVDPVLAPLLGTLGIYTAQVAVVQKLGRCLGGGGCYAPLSLARWTSGIRERRAWTAADHEAVIAVLGAVSRNWYWHAARDADSVAVAWLVADAATAEDDDLVALFEDEGVIHVHRGAEGDVSFQPEALQHVPTEVVAAYARRFEVGWTDALLNSGFATTVAGRGFATELRARQSSPGRTLVPPR